MGRERSICHKSHSFTSPSPSLHQKTRCLGKLFCYFLERVFVRRFPVKQVVIIDMCGYHSSLTSAYSRRSRFTVVETSPVSERTFQSCSCNILVFTRETCTGKESFEQARFSTYHFYIRHIRAAINFHEGGRQSTRSSPEVCLQNASRNLTRISRHFFGNTREPREAWPLKRPRKAWNW